MGANIYPPAKVDEKKYRENYDRIFNKGNNMHDELHMEIADLKEQIAELEKLLHESAQTLQDMVDGNMALMARNKKYREALEFYAKKDNYTELHDYKGLHYFEIIGSSPLQDQGDVARQALNK